MRDEYRLKRASRQLGYYLVEDPTMFSIFGNLLPMSCDRLQSEIVLLKLPECSSYQIDLLLNEMLPHVITMSQDLYAKDVVCKIIELACSSKGNQQKLTEYFYYYVAQLSLHEHGRVVVCKLLSTLEYPLTQRIINDCLRPYLSQLSLDGNGVHVVKLVMQVTGDPQSQYHFYP